MKTPTIEGLQSLSSSTLMDILVEYTSRYTRLLSDRMNSDQLEVIRETIQIIQQEIIKRHSGIFHTGTTASITDKQHDAME